MNARVIKTGQMVDVVQWNGKYYMDIKTRFVYYPESLDFHSEDYHKGYDKAKQDILDIIQSRISEIIGDAQPKPALRAELQEIIKRIKDENENT